MTIERVIPPRKQPLSVDRIHVYVDGVVFKNPPHPAAWSFLVYLNDEKIFQDSGPIERPQCNEVLAKQEALRHALAWLNCQDRFSDYIVIHNDNLYLMASMNWAHRAPDNEDYKPLWMECRRLASPFPNIQYVWITKLKNAECRALTLQEIKTPRVLVKTS